MSDYRNQCHLCTWRHEDSIVILDGTSWIAILHCDFSAWMFWKEELWPHYILQCPGMQLSLYNQIKNSPLTGNLIVYLGIINHKLCHTSTQTWWQLYPLFEFVIQEKGFIGVISTSNFIQLLSHICRETALPASVEGHSSDDNCGWWLSLLNSIQHTIHLYHSVWLKPQFFFHH